MSVAVLAAALDLSRAPERQWSTAVTLGGIHLYQRYLSSWSPLLGGRCRFQPTCSHYAEASIRRHGVLAGGWRSFVRILRCGPWTPAGTVDPPS
jgi:hypothetical protein